MVLSKRLHHEIYTCSVRFEGGQQASLRLSRVPCVDVASSKRSLTFLDVRAHTTCAAEGHRLRFEVVVGVSTSASQTLRIRHVPFSSAVARVRTPPSGSSRVSPPSRPHTPAAWRVHVPPWRKTKRKVRSSTFVSRRNALRHWPWPTRCIEISRSRSKMSMEFGTVLCSSLEGRGFGVEVHRGGTGVMANKGDARATHCAWPWRICNSTSLDFRKWIRKDAEQEESGKMTT